MFIVIIIIIAIFSVGLALFSLWKQSKVEELKRAKKELKRKKVIFYSDSS